MLLEEIFLLLFWPWCCAGNLTVVSLVYCYIVCRFFLKDPCVSHKTCLSCTYCTVDHKCSVCSAWDDATWQKAIRRRMFSKQKTCRWTFIRWEIPGNFTADVRWSIAASVTAETSAVETTSPSWSSVIVAAPRTTVAKYDLSPLVTYRWAQL